MGYLLGLDIGTSQVKALLITVEGEIVGSASQEYPLYSPRPGWTEQNPEDMWQGTITALRKVLDKYDVDPADIKVWVYPVRCTALCSWIKKGM